MIGLASPLTVVVLADVVLLQCWTVGLFWRYGGEFDWTFMRAPFDNRYGAVGLFTGLYAFGAIAAHGTIWLVAATSEFAFGDLIGVVALVAVGLLFLVGASGMYPDVEDLHDPPVTESTRARERFFQDWFRGMGWTFLTVATTTVAVTRTFGPVVW